jgi:peptidoglycan/xylan/chitin deacetylase (PgdA/CDA1 family)
MTSLWAKHHKKEFLTLQKWQKEGKLDITWGNHTYTHPYKKNIPLKQNFVLIKGYNLLKDTLNMEKFYISHNITPSIFFRFPGLISNKHTINEIKMLGLITIGSNTWLAKGEKIKNNSIILIHGNKNEEKGVKIFLKELKKIPHLTSLSHSL